MPERNATQADIDRLHARALALGLGVMSAALDALEANIDRGAIAACEQACNTVTAAVAMIEAAGCLSFEDSEEDPDGRA